MKSSLFFTFLIFTGLLSAFPFVDFVGGVQQNDTLSKDANKASDGLLAIATVELGKFGFINTRGEWVIEPIYDNVGQFSEGLAYVHNDSISAFINTEGQIVIDNVTKMVNSPFFYNGLAACESDEEQAFMINRKGKKIIQSFNYLGNLSHGLIPAQFFFDSSDPGPFMSFDNAKSGYITPKGRWAIETNLLNTPRDFHEGLVVIQLANDKFGALNTKGDTIIEPEYILLSDFHSGVACACSPDRTCQFIDKTGKTITDEKFFSFTEFSDGHAFAVTQDEKLKVIDSTGTTIFVSDKLYERITTFSGGVASFIDDSTSGFLNLSLSVIFEMPEADGVLMGNFINGYAFYLKDGKIGIMNDEFEKVVNPRFLLCGDFLDPEASNAYQHLYYEGEFTP